MIDFCTIFMFPLNTLKLKTLILKQIIYSIFKDLNLMKQ